MNTVDISPILAGEKTVAQGLTCPSPRGNLVGAGFTSRCVWIPSQGFLLQQGPSQAIHTGLKLGK